MNYWQIKRQPGTIQVHCSHTKQNFLSLDPQPQLQASVVDGVTTGDATFQCLANADRPIIFWWTSADGVLLSNSSKYSLSSDGARLTIKNLHRSDKGNYTCHVRIELLAETARQNSSVTGRLSVSVVSGEQPVRT